MHTRYLSGSKRGGTRVAQQHPYALAPVGHSSTPISNQMPAFRGAILFLFTGCRRLST